MKTPVVQIGELALDGNEAFKIGPSGSSLKRTELVRSGIPVAGIENVLPNSFEKRFRRFITKDKFTELSDYEIVADDVLVTTMGTIGRAAVVPPDLGRAIFHSHLCRIRVDTTRVIPSYLCYALNRDSIARQLSRLAKGSIMEGLNTAMLRECLIPLPDVSGQRRIIAELDQAARFRVNRRYAYELSDTCLPAAFLEIFGNLRTNSKEFPVIPAGDLYQIQLGKMLDTKQLTGKYLKPYLGNANVQWGRFELDNLKFMDFPDDFEKFKLLPGDLLVCEGGEAGRTAIWRGEVRDCGYQKALHRLRPKGGNILAEYFLFYMRAAVASGLVAQASSTSTFAHFTAARLEEFPVLLPPLPLQQKFASLFSSIERVRAIQTEACRQADHLFESVLHKVFQTEELRSHAESKAHG